MGLLDQVLGGVLGQMGGATAPAQSANAGGSLLEMAMQFVSSYPGGLPALLAQLQQAGLGQQAQSWIGTGPNMSLSPDDLASAIGPGQLQQMGQQFGLDPRIAAGGLAGLLPEIINQLTPQGQLEPHVQQAQGDELASLLNGLRSNFG
jgi:uncharacterized protein YidB (DUF937 family)